MKFSVIIPWKSGNKVREENLRNMFSCLKVQECEFEVVIIEQTNDKRSSIAKETIMSLLPQELATKYSYVQLNNDGPFNKSWCMNVGARMAKYDNLVFTDADSLFGRTFLKEIEEKIKDTQVPHKFFFSCWDVIICMPGKDNLVVRYMRNDDIRTMGGIWYAERNFFFEIFGGMNENFIGYGAEDNEAYSRAVSILNCTSIVTMNYTLIHQYHDWESYNKLASKLFDKCMINPHEIIRRLIKKQIGNIESPSYINIEDFNKG